MTEEFSEHRQSYQNMPSPRELIFRYVYYLPWIFVTIAIMLLLAWVKLRYSTPIYSVNAKLLVKNPFAGGNANEKFDDIFMMQQGNRNLQDEMEIIRSRNMAQRVVNSLRLQTMYINKGKIRSTAVYPSDVPFNFHIISLADSSRSFDLPLVILDDNEYRIGESSKTYTFGQILERPEGKFLISRNQINLKSFGSNEFIIDYQTTSDRAKSISGNLRVGQASDYSSVLTLTFETENPRIGADIVNQYMKEYQASSLEDKRQILVNTLAFIDDQLVSVKQDLGSVEKNLQEYREKNKTFNTELQTEMFFGDLSNIGRQLTEQGVKLQVIDYLIKYLSDEEKAYRVVPTTLGIDEPALLQMITEYNKLQLERETLLKTTPATNPLVVNIQTALTTLRTDIVQNLNNIRQTYVLALNELSAKNKEFDQAIRSIPEKEKQLLDITRQQKILEELYSYLLQKKLETAISSASTISNIRVLEPAMYSNVPIKPNRRSIYLLAVFLGILIPVAILVLLEYLNDKVKTRTDIERNTDAPIIGEVGHSDEPGALVVTQNNRKFIAEQFRMVRTNLQYILPKVENPVLLVTSTFSGEGKSFVSTNLGAVLAVSGRKTIILELDIRKPKILKGLGLNERKGITNYIVGSVGIDEIIYPVPDANNLYVMPCGPVPPNPAEMLLDERVNQLFAELRNRFDAIIIDSAPVGLVSDAITLGKHADATIYIVRYNYTLKKQFKLIEDVYKQKKLPRLSLVINDVRVRGGYGGYYGYDGYYGYGNGYGYGADSGYFENGKPKKKWWKPIRSRS
jgi:tyrosine-protein kinase Etk/Wzc